MRRTGAKPAQVQRPAIWKNCAKSRSPAERPSHRRHPCGRQFDCVAVGDDNQFACTGTLIGPDVVLTAGHCQAFHTRVFVGTDVTKQGRIFRIRKHVPHPKFDRRTMVNDLTILFLDKKVTGVTPRKVAPKALIDNATTARVVGFGSTRLDGMGFLSAKLAADVPIVSPSCGGTVNGETDEDFYGCHLTRTDRRAVLHLDTTATAAAAYVQNPNGDWLLTAATYRSTDVGSTMCGGGGRYVRGDDYAEWIKSVLDEGKRGALRKVRAKTRAKAGLKAAAKSKPKSKAKTASKPKPKAKEKGKGR